MTAAIYHRKMARALDRMGGLYTLQDLLVAIAENRMQGFAVNNSWAITQVQDFPRARKLQIVAMVGDLADVDELQAKVLTYARDVNAGLVSAYGRLGWIPHARELGWRLKAKNYLYHKDM
ncbi:MAG TPA: hypothetical protein VNX47_13065 [Nevskia sp.]|jgi:hypothetical protein|nr:hypothetical protein [Nevskia sp.]